MGWCIVTARLHHVLVCCPVGGEDAARRFYGELLGLTEVAKPPGLAGRGGVWFREPGVELHVGVDEHFTPARKAHPAFVVDDLSAVEARLVASGHPCTPDAGFDDGVHAYRRCHSVDGAGNQVELLGVVGCSRSGARREL